MQQQQHVAQALGQQAGVGAGGQAGESAHFFVCGNSLWRWCWWCCCYAVAAVVAVVVGNVTY